MAGYVLESVKWVAYEFCWLKAYISGEIPSNIPSRLLWKPDTAIPIKLWRNAMLERQAVACMRSKRQTTGRAHYQSIQSFFVLHFQLTTRECLNTVVLRGFNFIPYWKGGRNLCTYLLTRWCRVLLEKLEVLQLIKKFPHSTELEGSLPHSQASATCLYPGPAQSSPYTQSHLLESHPNIIHPSTPRSPQCHVSTVKYPV